MEAPVKNQCCERENGKARDIEGVIKIEALWLGLPVFLFLFNSMILKSKYEYILYDMDPK